MTIKTTTKTAFAERKQRDPIEFAPVESVLLVDEMNAAQSRGCPSSQPLLRRSGGCATSRLVVAAFRRSHDDTAKTQEDRMNAVTTNQSHAVAYIDKEFSIWRRKRPTLVPNAYAVEKRFRASVRGSPEGLLYLKFAPFGFRTDDPSVLFGD